MSKGTIWDLFIIMSMLFLFVISVITSHYVITQLSGESGFTSSTATSVLNSAEIAVETFNYGYVIIAVSLAIGSVLMVFYLPTNPAFIIVGIILLVILMVIAPQLSNAYYEFRQNEIMVTSAASFNIMNYMFDSLPLFLTVFGAIILIVYYAKTRMGVISQ